MLRLIRSASLGILLLASVASAQTVNIQDGQSFALAWSKPVEMRAQQTGRELLLQFDRPLEGAALDQLASHFDGLLEGVQQGYDTLLLTLATDDVDAKLQHRGAVLRVALSRPAATQRVPSEDALLDNRLELERARLLLKLGSDGAARDKLQTLRAAEPENTDPLLLLADLESRQGRWRDAVALYDRALELSPDPTDVVRSRAQLLREKGSFLRSDTDVQKVEGNERQIIERVTGRVVAPKQPYALGFAYELRHIRDNLTPRADGSTTKLDDYRHRLDLWGEVDPGWGALRATLLLGPTAVGGSVEGTLRHKDAETRARVTYHEPYWDQLVGLVDGGTLDRVEAAHRRTLRPGLDGELGFRVSRYGLGGDESVATGFGPSAALRWTLPVDIVTTSLGYGLYAEYINRRDTRLNGAGAEFQPLAIGSVEIHSFDVTVGDRIGESFRWSLTGGYGWDRLNGAGPLFGAELVYEPLVGLEAGLRFNHAETSTRTGSVVNRGGFYLTWRF